MTSEPNAQELLRKILVEVEKLAHGQEQVDAAARRLWPCVKDSIMYAYDGGVQDGHYNVKDSILKYIRNELP